MSNKFQLHVPHFCTRYLQSWLKQQSGTKYLKMPSVSAKKYSLRRWTN